MNLKIDESLPSSLQQILLDRGHDAHTVYDEGLQGHDDAQVWASVRAEGRFCLTQDAAFARRAMSAPHPGLLLIRLRHPSRAALESRVAELFDQHRTEDWSGAIVTASDH